MEICQYLQNIISFNMVSLSLNELLHFLPYFYIKRLFLFANTVTLARYFVSCSLIKESYLYNVWGSKITGRFGFPIQVQFVIQNNKWMDLFQVHVNFIVWIQSHFNLSFYVPYVKHLLYTIITLVSQIFIMLAYDWVINILYPRRP